MTTSKLAVLLTLTAIANYQRRDLTGDDMLPIAIKRGDTIKVTEDIADQLLDDDNSVPNGDDDRIPYFSIAAEGTAVTYDFTADKQALGEPSVKHDLSTLPEERLITDVIAEGGGLARKTPVSAPRAQRAPRSTNK